MARLYTDTSFSGTFGNLTVYRVGDKCYARTKSSLDRKRFQKDPAFAKSREKAALFGEAARLVKEMYATLPKAVKQHGLFGKLTAMAYKGLQEKKGGEVIIQELKVYCEIEKEKVPVETITATARNRKVLKMHKPHLSPWYITASGKLGTNRREIVFTKASKQVIHKVDPQLLTPDG